MLDDFQSYLKAFWTLFSSAGKDIHILAILTLVLLLPVVGYKLYRWHQSKGKGIFKTGALFLLHFTLFFLIVVTLVSFFSSSYPHNVRVEGVVRTSSLKARSSGRTQCHLPSSKKISISRSKVLWFDPGEEKYPVRGIDKGSASGNIMFTAEHPSLLLKDVFINPGDDFNLNLFNGVLTYSNTQTIVHDHQVECLGPTRVELSISKPLEEGPETQVDFFDATTHTTYKVSPTDTSTTFILAGLEPGYQNRRGHRLLSTGKWSISAIDFEVRNRDKKWINLSSGYVRVAAGDFEKIYPLSPIDSIKVTGLSEAYVHSLLLTDEGIEVAFSGMANSLVINKRVINPTIWRVIWAAPWSYVVVTTFMGLLLVIFENYLDKRRSKSKFCENCLQKDAPKKIR